MSELPARSDPEAASDRQTVEPTAIVVDGPRSLEPLPEAHRHPALGLPPADMTAGFPAAAERLRLDKARLAARALEAATDHDPAIASRYDELGLRRLLHDTELLLDTLTLVVASGDPFWAKHYAEQTAIVYRRRQVPMADLVVLLEGIRDAAGSTLGPEERAALDAGIAAAAQVYEWNGRIAGDARRRNALLRFLYRGA